MTRFLGALVAARSTAWFVAAFLVASAGVAAFNLTAAAVV